MVKFKDLVLTGILGFIIAAAMFWAGFEAAFDQVEQNVLKTQYVQLNGTKYYLTRDK